MLNKATCRPSLFPVHQALQKRNRSQGAASISPGMGDRVALLRRTFGEEVGCPDCCGRLRLIALVKKEETIQTLLKAMHLPTQATGPPERVKSEPAEPEALELKWSREGENADWLEYPD